MEMVLGHQDCNDGRIPFNYCKVYSLISSSIVLRITHLTKQLLREYGGAVPAALWPWDRISLWQKRVQGIFPGGKGSRCL